MFLKKNAAKAQAVAIRADKKDLMEAICAGAILVAYADGEVEDTELKKLEEIISANEAMGHFTNEIPNTITRYVGLMKASKYVGTPKLMKEIGDVNGSVDEKIEVFGTVISIAEADGEIDDKEKAVLSSIGRALGLSLSQFGL